MKVFHHNDNDGYAAAFCVRVFEKSRHNNLECDDFIEVDYNTKPSADLISEGETVYIVDYSFTDTTVLDLYAISEKANGNVYWYDHHKTSLEILDKVKEDGICKEVIVDMDRSAARIVYEELLEKDPMSPFSGYLHRNITLVDDYDRWVHEYTESIWFNLGSVCELVKPYNGFWYCDPEKTINNGKTIYSYNLAKNRKICNNLSYTIKINGHSCIVLNSPESSSQVFGPYFDLYKFGIRYAFDGEKYRYSVYSQLEDIDCAKIAKYFDKNGGGHKGAAGFMSDKILFKSEDEFIIE